MHYVYTPHIVLDDSLGPKLAAQHSTKLDCQGCELETTAALVEDICDECIYELKKSYDELCDDCFDTLEEAPKDTFVETDDTCTECDSHQQQEEDYICDDCIDKYLYVCSICKECL